MVKLTIEQDIEIPRYMLQELIQIEVAERIKNEQLVMSISLNELVRITGVSKSLLEKSFVPRPETKAVEYRVGTKRLWLYPEIREVWREFLYSIN